MTREQAKAQLIAMGVVEPTDEAISTFLNTLNNELKGVKDKNEKLKADADKVAELQAQLDAINEANMTEIEKVNKQKQDALDQIAKLQADMAQMQLKNQLAEIGIVGENADKLFADGKLDVSVLGEILKTKIETAKSDAIKEIADNADSQGASSGAGSNDGGDEETPDVAMAKSLVFGTPAVEKAVRDAYVLH